MASISYLSTEKWGPTKHERGTIAWVATMYQCINADPDRYTGGYDIAGGGGGRHFGGIDAENYYRAYCLIKYFRMRETIRQKCAML